ncbi:MAG: type II toxin-antitoxin system VapC family toxin [Acidobacteriaceae bacterium]
MSKSVLDSSVLLAILKNEQLDDEIQEAIEGAAMSAVNFTEVWTKIYDLGLTEDPRIGSLFSLLSRIEPFTESQARLAADLRTATRHAGLSLGDRACLALALTIRGEVYTADRQWQNVNVGCDIHLIR